MENIYLEIDLTTIIPLSSASTLSLDRLQDELRKLEPDVDVADVIDTDTSPQQISGGHGVLLKVNGLRMAVISINVALPVEVFVYGPSPTFLWMSAQKDLAAHTCHTRVLVMEEVDSRDALLRAARAQTLVTAAVCNIVPAMGVLWCASDNLLPLDRFLSAAVVYAQEGQAPAEIWVRLMAANTENGLLVATHGLASYVGREVEFTPTRKFDFGTLGMRIMQISQYLIESGVTLREGEVIAPEQFEISLCDKASFDGRPVYVLRAE